MKALALARSEFIRLTATPLARLAFVALMIVPLLYGGAYLWANQNPYAKLNAIPAAIVNTDSGAKDAQGDPVNYGDKVTQQLVDAKTFQWHVVSAAQAAKGIKDETYNFVFTIPSSFSTDLTSTGSSDPTAAKITLTTNDTTSYLSSTIADQAATTIRDTVTKQVSATAASTLLVGLNDVRSNLADAATGSQKLVDGSKQLQSGLGTANSGATSLASGASQLASGASTLSSGLQTLKSSTTSLPSQTAALASGLDTLKTATNDLPSQTAALSSGLDTLKSSTASLPAQTKALASGLDTLRSSTTALPSSAKTLAAGADTLSTGAGALASTVSTLATQSAAVSATLPADAAARLAAAGFTPEQITQMLGGTATLQALSAAATPLASGAGAVKAGADTLSTQAPALAAGIGQAAAGADTLASKTPALTSGISAAAGGADTLAANASALSNGIAQASAGASRLSAAAPQLTDGIASAATGAASLSTGADSAKSGAASLASGLSKLDSGASSLTSGATTLTSGLNTGVKQIPATTASSRDKQAAAIASPVSIKDASVASAGSYGAGLAPFFISLAAWIGMYALFLIIKPISKRAITAVKAPARITLAAWLTPAILGLVQMLALFAIVKFALNFPVAHPLPMIGIMVLASITFAAIIMTLNILLGSVGQFLGLVLMLIQLVTAGGTFPWQTLPAPLAALHHVLPMTFAVDAIRQMMYGGSSSAAWQDAGILALWLLGALLVAWFSARRMTRRRTMRDLRPSLIGG